MNENEMRLTADKWRRFATVLTVAASILVFIAGIVTSRDPFSGEFLFLPFLLFCLLAGVGIAAWYGLWEMMTAYLHGMATITAHLKSPAPSVAVSGAAQRAQGRDQAVLSYGARVAAKAAQPAVDENAELLQRIQRLEIQLAAAQSQQVTTDAPPAQEETAVVEPVIAQPTPVEAEASPPVVEPASPAAEPEPATTAIDAVVEPPAPDEPGLVAAAFEETRLVDSSDDEPDTVAFDEPPVPFEGAGAVVEIPDPRPVCASCGADNPPGFAFCTSCGTPARP